MSLGLKFSFQYMFRRIAPQGVVQRNITTDCILSVSPTDEAFAPPTTQAFDRLELERERLRRDRRARSISFARQRLAANRDQISASV